MATGLIISVRIIFTGQSEPLTPTRINQSCIITPGFDCRYQIAITVTRADLYVMWMDLSIMQSVQLEIVNKKIQSEIKSTHGPNCNGDIRVNSARASSPLF